MFIKNTFIFFALFFVAKVYAQNMNYEDMLDKALAHQQTQNAANVVLWNSEHFLLNVDSFSFDQSKGQLIVKSGKYRVTYNIKILGTYDQQDTTFLWSPYNKSIHKDLTTPVSNLISIASLNHWAIAKTTQIKCSFDSAYKLATLAFYLDNANGIYHILTNNERTNVIFSFYEVEVYDNVVKKMVIKVSTKKQYKFVIAPALINTCKNYVSEFEANEKKYYQLYKQYNDNGKFLDTMFVNRIKISDKFWDTTSTQYALFRTNRMQADNIQKTINWRVIDVNDIKYVLYDEQQSWGPLSTWAFQICEVKGEYKICNEYLCF